MIGRRAATAAALALALASCAAGAPDPAPPRPPDRAAFARLGSVDRAIHALALTAALEAPDAEPRGWHGDGPVSGSVTALAAVPGPEGLTCRRFAERLTAPTGDAALEDVACRGPAGWAFARPGGTGPAVLAPVEAWPPAKIHVTPTQTTLAVVARRHRAPIDLVARLNPELPQRLPPGSRVRLP